MLILFNTSSLRLRANLKMMVMRLNKGHFFVFTLANIINYRGLFQIKTTNLITIEYYLFLTKNNWLKFKISIKFLNYLVRFVIGFLKL